MNVIVADDHSVVRKGLIQILKEKFEISVLGEATNTGEVENLLKKNAWDILILDLSMPGKNGIELIKDIKNEYPRIPVLVLSIYPEDQFALRVIKAGASGYMTKESSTEELVKAVEIILSGKKYISSKLTESLIEEIQSGGETLLHRTLSDREYEVFLLLVHGYSLKDIGENLSLSVKTISTYQSRVFDKMKLHSVAELTRYALENKLLQD